MFIKYQPNPRGRSAGDCVIRAISKATGQDWDTTYAGVCRKGYELCDMPSSDYVWGEYLKDLGFRREVVPDDFGSDYTVETFAAEHFRGTYILAIGGHVVCVVDGNWYDSWNSGNEVPVFYWAREYIA